MGYPGYGIRGVLLYIKDSATSIFPPEFLQAPPASTTSSFPVGSNEARLFRNIYLARRLCVRAVHQHWVATPRQAHQAWSTSHSAGQPSRKIPAKLYPVWIGTKNKSQDTLTGSVDVAIVISLLECPKNRHCPNPFDELGATLYQGPYKPQFPTFPTPDNEPQQNFTVIVPGSFDPGSKAQLAVTHLSLVGVSGSPFFIYITFSRFLGAVR